MAFCSGSDGHTLSRAKSAAKTASNLAVVPLPTPDERWRDLKERTALLKVSTAGTWAKWPPQPRPEEHVIASHALIVERLPKPVPLPELGAKWPES
jgi:hypothetical protein